MSNLIVECRVEGRRRTGDVLELADVLDADLLLADDLVDLFADFAHRFWILREVVEDKREQA